MLSRIRDAVQRFGALRAVATVGRRVMPALDRFVDRLTGGRFRLSDLFVANLILVSEGHRTGKRRETPLAYVRDGSAYVLVATNWGQDRDPAWAKNLRAQPEVAVRVEDDTTPVKAREADRDEFERLYPKFMRMWPAYRSYLDRVGDARDIPMFILEPRSGP